jgi:hypothetical protein
MVTESIEQQAPLPEPTLATTEVAEPTDSVETAATSEATVDSPVETQTTTEAPEVPAESVAEEAPASFEEMQLPPPTTLPPAPSEAAPVPQYTPEQIRRLEQESIQYEQVRQQQAMQNQVQTYRQQLESQGYLPEHAEQAANFHAQNQQRFQQETQTILQQADQRDKHVRGKQVAAEQFAVKYSLNIGDLATLRMYEDPQTMERAAQVMSENRKRDAELAALKQARVPAQALDNSQGSPEVAADEGGWLQRYNEGDRSPSAQAAAKKAAGLA